MNDNSNTGTLSALDLSLCHPSLYLDSIGQSVKLNKANWDLFHTLCDESLTTASLSNSTDRIADFTSSLIDISERCIPKTLTNPKKVTRGIMTTVKKLLNREKKLCLGSVNFQLKIT